MSNTSKNAKLSGLLNLKHTVEAYEEIAAMRMRRVKISVLDNREFLKELSGLLGIVRNSNKELSKIMKKKDKKIDERSGTLLILLSSNTGLYGTVIRDTFNKFYEDTLQNKNADLVIIGKLGKKLYDESKENRKYQFFNLSDSGKDEKTMSVVIDYLKKYEHVIVYHSIFKDILKQETKVSYITGNTDEVVDEKVDKTVNIVEYIYEPSLGQIAGFFETQIVASLFQQSVYESSLSKFASRMISLDSAVVNVNKQLKNETLRAFKSSHYIKNKSQQNLISSISIWNN